MYIVTTSLFFLMSAYLVSCNCPKEEIHHLGSCVYQIRCFKTVKGAVLGPECQGSTNNEVIVDLTLTNVDQRFHVDVADTEFLTSLTSLRVHGTWTDPNLDLLNFTIRLKKLNLANLQMKTINESPFIFLRHLETLDLSHNQLSDIDELFVFNESNKLKKLYLSYNEIKEVTGYVFQELKSLVELDLSNNLIEDLNEEPFSNLTNLEILRLNNNFIKSLNGAINKKLLNLKHLFLNNNEISRIDDKTLDKIYHLETFELSSNKLQELQPALLVRHWDHFNGYLVCRMIYSRNQLTVIKNANAEEHLQNFDKHRKDIKTHLDLSNNKIKNIEYNAFQSIINLVSLDLSKNELYDFVIESQDLTDVKFINISSNYITKLDFKTFSLMKHLQNLDLSNNRFENTYVQSLISSEGLQRLNFSHNDIQQVTDFHFNFHSEGGILDLSKNSLTSFIISPGEAEGLIELILHSNNISDPTQINLKHHRDLMKLDMSKNFIIVLKEESLQLPITLVYLDLSYNNIQVMGPSAFIHVNHLHTLRLAHNDLRNIEYGVFRGLTSLLNLDISFNEIAALDSKVFLDLKFLKFLSLRHNEMTHLECKSWVSHKTDLTVYVDGNKLSCEWLGSILTDYNNGYTKVRPAALVSPVHGHTLEGIPCEQGPQNIIYPKSTFVITDERLLATNQKILEAVQTQTSFLRKYIWRSVLEEANKKAKMLADENSSNYIK